METWAWLAAYLLGFALLQVYLYVYFMRGRSATRESPTDGPRTSPAEGGSPAAGGRAAERSEDLVHCESCGTYNRHETMFVYCKACGDRLE